MLRNWKKRTFVQTIFHILTSIVIKNIFVMKHLTDFHRTVKTGVDPHLLVVPSSNPQPCV